MQRKKTALVCVASAAAAMLLPFTARAAVLSDAAASLLIGHGNWTSYGLSIDPLPKASFHDGLSQIITYLRYSINAGVGYDFGGMTTVNSFYIAQDTAGRQYGSQYVMYYSAAGGSVNSQVVNVPGTAATVTFAPIHTGFIYVVPRTLSGGGYEDPAITEFYVEGTPATARTNVLAGIGGAAITASNWSDEFEGGSFFAGSRLTDGQMAGDGEGSMHTGSIWINSTLAPDATNNYIQFDLGDAKTVSTLGLLQQLGGTGFTRKIVTPFELQFSNTADFSSTVATYDFSLGARIGYVQVDFSPTTARYVRFIATGRDGVGTDDYQGIAELQLFTPVTPVPEPASLSLLAIGGLALLRRRRK